MPSPKSGTAGVIVPPAAPQVAQDADDAHPGTVEQVKAGQKQTQTGKYGTQPVKPYHPPPPRKPLVTSPKSTHWIEVKVLDDDGHVMPGDPFKLVLVDGSVHEGTLDEKGLARLDDIDPGTCVLSLPNREDDEWSHA